MNNVKYAIKLGNGRTLSDQIFNSASQAESAISTLPLEEQASAMVVPVTTEGKEVLLG